MRLARGRASCRPVVSDPRRSGRRAVVPASGGPGAPIIDTLWRRDDDDAAGGRLVLGVVAVAALGTAGIVAAVEGAADCRSRGGAADDEDDLVLLHREVGIAGRVPRSVPEEPLSAAQGAAAGGTLRVGAHLGAAVSRRRPRRLDLRGRARRARGRDRRPTEQELIAKMYPDQATFRKEERRRFELLVAHWDVPLKPDRPGYAGSQGCEGMRAGIPHTDSVGPGPTRSATRRPIPGDTVNSQ